MNNVAVRNKIPHMKGFRGHLGRFIVWTSSAFSALDQIYGTTVEPSALKKDYLLPSTIMKQADLSKIINSSDVQKVLRPTRGGAVSKRGVVQKKNPLKNFQVQLRLNPYAAAFSKEKLGQAKVEKTKEVSGEGFTALLHEN